MSNDLTKKFLFFIDGDKLKSYRFNGKEFQLMKYKGGDFYPSADKLDSFWEWWEDAVAFTKDDCFNFCFLSSQKKFEIQLDYTFSKENKFNLENIESFITSLKIPSIEIIGDNFKKRYHILFENLSDYYNKNEGEIQKIYLSTYPEGKIIDENNMHKEETHNVKEIAPQGILFKYYQNKTDSINKG